MPVRMTGMISGMDTESLIKGMVDAQRLKNKRVEDKSTLLTWKQDKWKELNQKLYKLYTDDLSKMRLQGNYQTKKVTSANTKVSVTAGTNAPTGSHLISVEQLASSQYVTSGKLPDSVNTNSTLKDLGMVGDSGSLVIQIKNGDTKRNFVVDDKTTLGNFIDALKEAGLNANFDTAQKRLFISSKSSGKDNEFSITTGEISTDGAEALSNIRSLVNFAGIGSAGQTKVLNAINVLEGKSISDALYDNVMGKAPGEKITGANADEQKIIDALVVLRDYAISKVQNDTKTDTVKQIKDDIKESLRNACPNDQTLIDLKNEVQSEVDNGTLPSGTNVEQIAKERYAVLNSLKEQVASQIASGSLTVPDDKTKEEFIEEHAQMIYDTLIPQDKANMFNTLVEKEYKSTETITDVGGNTITKAEYYQNKVKTEYDSAINDNIVAALDDKVNNKGLVADIRKYTANSTVTGIPGNSTLQKIGLDEITGVAHEDTSKDKDGYSVIASQDSIVTVDGARLTGKTNTITANGLTITANGITAPGETISIDVANNTQETYDMIKNFIKSYNTILKEMNELYYAPSSRGFDPLSDDEKQAMTDGQIEKWEKKIQDSILRRDTTLSSVLGAMKNAMLTRVEVDGKYYSLSSYGIQTSSDYTEKGLLHIYGDKEDGVYSSLDDKLMKALEEDPDTVVKVLSKVSMALYEAMGEKMSSIPNVRSAYTFYNDKTMAKQQTEYKKKIALLENKVVAMENKYYKQFAAMETALAKMQSQSNALAGMLGMKQQ